MGIPAFLSRLRLVAMAERKEDFQVFGKSSPFLKVGIDPYPKGPTFLGKLGFKVEPAGKVRVFAMVDAWTQ